MTKYALGKLVVAVMESAWEDSAAADVQLQQQAAAPAVSEGVIKQLLAHAHDMLGCAVIPKSAKLYKYHLSQRS